ncbi:MAG: Smr/MutS family protein [Alphaproteobacteria bacterium GM202ARS2]|nr:Smr/MutS family protein [Alphaproteobacteria bacterium GM202ARS2]
MTDKTQRDTSKALSQEDEALWQQEVEGITPIKGKRMSKRHVAPPIHVLSTRDDSFHKTYRPHERRVDDNVSDERGLAPLAVNKQGSSGVSRHEQRNLRKGQVVIDGRLDLHKLNREQARLRVHAFVRKGYATGARILHVITGTGKGRDNNSGVLRASLVDWLNEESIRPMVVLVSSAAGHHGGEGAFYVRLKRNRQLDRAHKNEQR